MYLAAALILLVGITLHEIRVIKYERDKQLHPYARRWRQRPIVSVDARNLPAIKHHYRNITQENQIGKYALKLQKGANIPRGELTNAVQFLEQHPHLASISLSEQANQIDTLPKLLTLYRTILSTPLHLARAGLYIPASASAPITLVATQEKTPLHTVWRTVYTTGATLLRYGTLLLVAYAFYVAFALAQPQLFMLITCAYFSYAFYAIWSYQHISLGDKVTYSLLAPVSPLYIFIVPIVASLHQLRAQFTARANLIKSKN